LALAFALLALAVLALSGRLGAAQGGVLIMLPALALAVMMLTRPFLGERVVARLRARRPRRAQAAAPIAARVRRRAGVARGGCLIATALAGRAPPLALASCR
jgi:hypothetical protein